MKILACTALFVAACAGPAGTAVDLPDGSAGIGFDDLRYSARLGKVLVPAGRSGALDLIDPASHEVTSISGFTQMDDYGGGHDDSVTSVDDTGRWLLATDRTAGRLEVVDPDQGAIVTGAALGGHPDYVRWVAETQEAWVTEPGLEQIEIFSLAADGTPTRTGTVDVPGGPESLVVDPVRHRAYTHLWDGATVAIDLAAREVVATWDNGCGGSRGIALDPDLGFLFVACQEGKLVLLDVEQDGANLAEVWPVDGSDVIDYSPTLHHVYTAGQISATVAVVGVSTDGDLAVLGEQDAALGSHCVVGDGEGGIYVCDPDAGRILVRDDPFDPITD
jgi:DNA-binding beta-propeller fold protein YncE